jgi:hypothetical protein
MEELQNPEQQNNPTNGQASDDKYKGRIIGTIFGVIL